MVKVFQPLRKAAEHPGRQLARAARAARRARVGGEPSSLEAGDVWQWTSSKYRVRAVVLLLVNALLFAGLGCFTFWLRTGDYAPFFTDQYWDLWWEAFDPVREHQVTLLDFLIYPIPVDQVPLMMVIVGLVLASLTAIPILVSMLYRFPFSLIFTAIICFVAMLPWLAFTVTLCCYLARLRPLRFSFRYATALISLLPVLAYYVLATRSTSAGAHLAPIELARLYMPWVMAIVGACLVMAVVLIIARVVNYRPGAIVPLMAVMFALPVILFETQVGRDELYYRLLQVHYGPGSHEHFADEYDAAGLIRRVAERRLEDLEDENATLESMMEQVQLMLQMRIARGQFLPDDVSRLVEEDFATERHQAIEQCRRFVSRFPKSRYVPNALYIAARATDMRIDPVYGGSRGTLLIRHYEDFPAAASRPLWSELQKNYPDSPLASLAMLRLATLEARDGQVDRAVELLDGLDRRFGSQKVDRPLATMNGWRDVLARRPASATIDVDPDAAVLEGRKLRALLVENRDPEQNDLPLKRLLSFDPRHPMYRFNLQRFLADIPRLYPFTRLGDNVRVLLARTQPSVSERIRQLRSLVQELSTNPASDAVVRARFELGTAYQEDNLPEEARLVFEEILRARPDSPWATEANRRLATINITARSAA